MRLIDADVLVKDLEHDIAIDEDILAYVGTDQITRSTTQFDKDCKQNAIDLVMGTPTVDADRPKGEWIPCSERLPSMEQDVLAWIEVERRIACCNYCNGHWFDAIMNTMVEPIAWMPLPKPYERSE